MVAFQCRGRILTTAAAAMVLQLVETLAQAADQPLSGGVGDAEDKKPVDAGQQSTAAPTPTNTNETQEDNKDDEALVLVTTPPTPTAKLDIPRVPSNDEGEKVTPVEKLEAEPTVDLAVADEGETPSVTQMPDTTVPVPTEAATTEAPEVLLQTTEPAVTPKATSKPSLRTQDPTLITDTATNNDAETHAPGYLDQGINPVVLLVLAGICCVFLLLWGRKRRLGRSSSSSSTSGGGSSKGPKVQYTQVPEEQTFSHSQDDDDEYCDEYEEDTFANDKDNWDDWEGSSPQAQMTQLNPFASPRSAPRPTTPRQDPSNLSPFKLSRPLPPPPQQQHAQLHEIAIAGKGDILPSSVESNSSSDSFEVVPEVVSAPPSAAHGAYTDVEKESEGVDDLFSQFGMVPMFKKSAAVALPPATATSQPVTAPVLSSVSSLPTAAEASAFFAAEMDDELTAVDAADEWGEDDEWVKGI